MGFFKIPRRERGFQNPTARISKSHGVSANFKIPRRGRMVFKIPRRMRVRAPKRLSERFGTQDDKSHRAAQENA